MARTIPTINPKIIMILNATDDCSNFNAPAIIAAPIGHAQQIQAAPWDDSVNVITEVGGMIIIRNASILVLNILN